MIGGILAGVVARLADAAGCERFDITRQWTEVPYLVRRTLFGKRSSGRIRVSLHNFKRSDADEMHDHPWPFVSLILSGGYYERTPAKGWRNGSGPTKERWYGPGRVLVRPAEWIHSVRIPEGREAWTLIVTGEKVRGWGFWCDRLGFVPWRQHLANAKKSGNGCVA